jgi:hypothetical protein
LLKGIVTLPAHVRLADTDRFRRQRRSTTGLLLSGAGDGDGKLDERRGGEALRFEADVKTVKREGA